MSIISTHTLIWLFPVAFMLHDFEEIILGEPWLKKNADDIMARIGNRVPDFMANQIKKVLGKSTTELALSVCLIFCLTAVASLLAAEYQQYGFFLAASMLFFVHGFMHLGQAVALRRYVPAVITSILIVIPYGLILFWRLINEGIVQLSELPIYALLGAVLTVPFILVMHIVGDYLYRQATRILIK